MKKVILFSLLTTILLFCFPFGFSQQSSKKEQLPPAAQKFLEHHFSNFEIYRVKYDAKNGEYEVKLQSGHEIEFDHNGDWFEIDGEIQPLPKSIIDMLPIGIPQYIAKNYPRRAIIKIEREAYGYEIELSNSIDLLFDKKGKFLKED
ncbi:MAG: PepSY-like domain-containing protein [Dysgonomonas sp.]